MFAVAGAQAADLPVKAKPVEYVKVCSLYGAGFFYVPGTDTCLKLGMYLRSDHAYNAGPGNYLVSAGTQQRFTRADTTEYNYRARMALSTDWRTQSDYGVVRAYALLIFQQNSTDPGIPGSAPGSQGIAGLHRAFIQFAGFTVGHAVSYFDFINGAAYGYAPSVHGASTGVVGTDLIAYTWQLGNGWSASIDIEDGRIGRPGTVTNASVAGTILGAANNGIQPLPAPDVAGNIRVDQAWGSAQIMAAAHNLNPSYYSPGLTTSGHPGNDYGWAIGGGFKLANITGPKDDLEFQITYGRGANSYTSGIMQNAWFGSGNSVGVGFVSEALYQTGTSLELSESWSFTAGYQHYWNPQWRTALYGGYSNVSYGATATAMICGAGTGGVMIGGAGSVTNCNPDWQAWQVSTRTAWNPHPTLEIGLDLIYAHLDTAFGGTGVLAAAAGARPAGTYVIEDQDYWALILRVQKTLLP
jgi:hypothetical protein